MMNINPAHDPALAEFFNSDAGKVALTTLMDFVGYNDMPEPVDVATANYNNGMKAVVARILIAYERVKNPLSQPNPNPLGFS